MAPPQFKVIIAGGGIAGLSLGVMLERAGIDYLILEAASQVHPLGGIVYLGAPVLRAFEQLGLLDDLFRQSNVMTGVTLMDHKLNKVSRINADFSKDRYGYHTLTIVRPKLYDILLSRIPAYKILFGKRVASTSQINDGVRVRCEDNSTYDGDILVAADGGSSPIRKAIYDQIQMRSKKLQYPADYAKPKLDQRCVIGVSEPMSVSQFPVLASKNCEMMLVMPKESNCIVWFVPMAEKRIGWGITSPLPSTIDSTTVSANSSLRGSRMSFESSTFDGTPSSTSSPGRGRSFSSASATSFNPHSATSAPYTGNYVDNFVMNNSSTYSVSNNSNSQFSSRSLKKRHSFGRLSKYSSSSSGSQKSSFDFQQYPSVLRTNDARDLDLDELPIERIWNKLDEKYTIEDSIRKQPCPYGGVLGDIIDSTSRKMITTVVVEEKFYHTWHLERTVLMGDGHGTTQGILDAISMASLLSDLPSNSATDVDALFRVHYERRGPIAKAAVSSSQHLDQLLFNRKLTGKLIRKMSTNWMSEWLSVKMVDRMFESRPILPFLQPVIERGSYKNKDPVPLLKDKRFAVARRKSLSSGYLTKGKKGSLRTKKEEDELQRDYMDLRIDSEMFSSSMPSILLPGSTTMTRPMPSMMDVEGTLIPMQSRPMDKEPLERDGHWHYYQGS